MSTKSSIRYQEKEGELPAWHLCREAFETEDVVYLEIEGVQADVTMIGSIVAAPNTGLLRLPTGTARQLGLVAPVVTKGVGHGHSRGQDHIRNGGFEGAGHDPGARTNPPRIAGGRQDRISPQ